MSKQSSIEWLWHNLTDDLIGDLPNEKIHKIYNLVLKAKQMHKKEIVAAINDSWNMAKNSNFYNAQAEQYYNETYGGDTK